MQNMSRWANYLISAVKYDSNKKIIQAKQHEDTGEDIGEGELVNRDVLTTNLKKGFTYCTIFNSNSTWKKGDPVNLIKADGGYSIRTDSNKVEYDNLRFISEIE